MDNSELLGKLIDLSEQMEIPIRRAPASESPPGDRHPAGALVSLKGNEIIFLDTSASLADQISLLATVLAGREQLADCFLPPQVREVLDQAN